MLPLPSLVALLGLFFQQNPASQGPLPPEASAKRMKTDPGLQVDLIAAEPDILQPIALTTDARGRLWVVECFSYPGWPKEPEKGRDRVVILEDKDGNGTYETRKVFLEKGSNLSGIAVGMGGVWLCSTPNLIFVPDANHDDRPDGPAKILIDGFDLSAKHNVSNSLRWGPDGWLWGCNGILSNSNLGKPGAADKDRLPINCGVWRYHPTRHSIEVVAHGTTNPWGLDFDRHGEAFITNCVISHLWHVQHGARFERMFGNDLNPHAYALMPTIADHLHWGGGHWTSSRGGKGVHSEAGGGHAHAGAAILHGPLWPETYQDSVVMLNIHGNRINRDKLVWEGASYRGIHQPDPVLSPDPWFRGVAMTTGPGDVLFFSDWTDTGECHNYDKADQTNGRVYRLTSQANQKVPPLDLYRESDELLARRIGAPGEWESQMARLVLQERAMTRPIAAAALQALKSDEASPGVLLRQLWSLHGTGQLETALLEKRSQSADSRVRGWAARLAGETGQIAVLIKMAKGEKDPWVRGVLASVANQVEVSQRGTLLEAISQNGGYTQQGPRLLYWYAVEPVLARDADFAGRFLASASDPLWIRFASRRIAQVASFAGKVPGGDWLISRLLADQVPADGMVHALAGINEALAQPGTPQPDRARVKDLIARCLGAKDPSLLGEAAKLAQLTRSDNAWVLTRRIVGDSTLPLELRQEILAQPRTDPSADDLGWLRELTEQPALRLSSWVTRARFMDRLLPKDILGRWKSLGIVERQKALELLVERSAWTGKLLDAIDAGQIPARDVPAHIARQIDSVGDKATKARLEKTWGMIRPPQKEKTARLQEWKTKLEQIELSRSDLVKGARVFEQSCGACHKMFGKGAELGPELTGGQRQSLDYWLENLLDPSAVVPREFKMELIELKNGRIIAAAVQTETPTSLTVRTTNETIQVPVAQIESRRPTNQSLMPEGQLERFTPEELRDLFGFLMSKNGPS